MLSPGYTALRAHRRRRLHPMLDIRLDGYGPEENGPSRREPAFVTVANLVIRDEEHHEDSDKSGKSNKSNKSDKSDSSECADGDHECEDGKASSKKNNKDGESDPEPDPEPETTSASSTTTRSRSVTTSSTTSSSPPPTPTSTTSTSSTSRRSTSTTSKPTSSSSSLPLTDLSTKPSSPTPVSTIWVTTGSVSTVTVGPSLTGPTASSSPVIIVLGPDGNGQDHDGDGRGQHDNGGGGGIPPKNAKFAIGFGVLGAVGFLVGLIWAAILIRRRRRQRHNRKDGLEQYATSDISSGDSSAGRSFKFLGTNRPGLGREKSRFTFIRSSKRSESSIMDEAMRAAYGTDAEPVPKGFLDEKRNDPHYPIPLLAPAPVHQASIRNSIATWFKRSSVHHPLKLNPISRWSRGSSEADEGPTTITGARGVSGYSELEDTDTASIRIMAAMQGTSLSPTDSVTMPAPLFSRGDAKPFGYYSNNTNNDTRNSQWDEMNQHDVGQQQQQQRESTMTASSWSSGARTTMQGPMTGGLSPPTHYTNNRATMAFSETESDGSGTVNSGGTFAESAISDNTMGDTIREELFALYSRTEERTTAGIAELDLAARAAGAGGK